MKRFSTETDDPAFAFDTGEYVLYEEAHQIEVDRNIKTANLQMLVDAVLKYDALDDTASTEELILAYDALVATARGLKQ